MASFCIEITKTLVVSVEAESFEEACENIKSEFEDGEYAKSWEIAEPQFYIVDVSEAPDESS